MQQSKTEQLEILRPFLRKKKIITSYLENVIFGNKNYTEHESNVDKNKNLSIKEYLDKIKPCFKDIINDLRKI